MNKEVIKQIIEREEQNMKKKSVLILALMLIFLFSGCSSSIQEDIKPVDSESMTQNNSVDAETEETQSTTEEKLKSDEEVENWDYPIKTWEDAQNSGLDFMGWKDICNPPEDVLHSFSTQELADLALRYPLFHYMPSGATDSEASVFIGVYQGYSSIFSELRNREDRNACILEAFAQNVPDIKAWNAYEFSEANWAEHFVEQYLFVYSKELTQEERMFYLKTVEEKTEKYYCNIEESNVVPGLSFDEDGSAYRKGYDGR